AIHLDDFIAAAYRYGRLRNGDARFDSACLTVGDIFEEVLLRNASFSSGTRKCIEFRQWDIFLTCNVPYERGIKTTRRCRLLSNLGCGPGAVILSWLLRHLHSFQNGLFCPALGDCCFDNGYGAAYLY